MLLPQPRLVRVSGGSVPRLVMSASGLFLLLCALCPRTGDSRIISDTTTFLKHAAQPFDMCSECSRTLSVNTMSVNTLSVNTMSVNTMSSTDIESSVRQHLQLLCQLLPADQASACQSQLDRKLTSVLQKPGHQKPADTCRGFGLCAANHEESLTKQHQHANKDRDRHGNKDASNDQINPACSFCLFMIKKLETLLPKNITEDALLKLLTQMCQVVPHRYKDQCSDFVAQYGSEIVEFLVSSAAPHTVCNLLHLCWFGSGPAVFPDPVPPSDCESCRTLALLSRLHLDQNSTRTQTSSFLRSVCGRHPHAVPKCETFVRIYGSRLQQVLEKQLERPDVCERTDLCAAETKPEATGKSRCGRGPRFWCRDRRTAAACGNEAFCEKFAWKQKE